MSGRMRPAEREAWILAEVPIHTYVDVLNTDFVAAYIEATGANYIPTMWGAHKCPQLGRDLSRMSRGVFRTLKRHRAGLNSGAWQPGFPKWVWCYRLPAGRSALEERKP